MKNKKAKDTRSRNWTLIVYPESAPKNWRSILDNEHISWIESPKHDKDINPDGTIKKAHWHILLMFATNKSFSQVKEVCDLIHSPIPQACRNIVGMVRYFIHADNPEKYQYDKRELLGHCGVDPFQYLQTSTQKRTDDIKKVEKIVDFIEENDIFELKDLVLALKGNIDLFEIVIRHTYFLNNYIKSKRYAARDELINVMKNK